MGNAAKVLQESTTGEMDKNLFNNWFDARMAEREAAHVPSMTIIATKGTLDMAYPPFILASSRGIGLGCIRIFYILWIEFVEKRFES
jgi:hypothetical protein